MVAANQSVYTELSHEIDVDIVVPSVWRDELRPYPYGFSRQVDSHAVFHPVAVFGIGRVQRHIHICSPVRVLQRLQPDAVIIEEEAFSITAWRWSRAARHLGVPYAVQSAENLERRLPVIVRWWERRVLSRCAWVMARSPEAARRSIRHGASSAPERVAVVAHGIDEVSTHETEARRGVVGYVGRLSEAKGVLDLLEVARRSTDLQFEFAGDGPLRDVIESGPDNVRWCGSLSPHDLAEFYRSVSVLAVPSRTTATWSEQFGRVIIEAQSHATPVVAYDSGEIPWVASETAVRVVAEGDLEALQRELREMALTPEGARVGREGRTQVAKRFTNSYAAEQVRTFLRRLTN